MSAILSSPHLPVRPSVAAVMRDVLIALVPGAAAFTWFFGAGVLTNLAVAMAAAFVFEALCLRVRARPLQPFLSDGSALLTGALLALSLPPGSPPWLIVVGCGFAMVLGKHLFGGLGYNPFNPAMVGFVVLLISFPVEMTAWSAPGASWAAAADAVSSATPLDHARTQLGLGRTLGEVQGDTVYGALAGRGWEWIALGYLAGGAWMLWRGTIRWHIPVAVLAALGALAAVFWMADADRFASPLFHWLSGAAMLGAFFIATDPVSAATTPRGRLVYGAGIGVLTYVIRTWGGYPDAIAFAVLLMNICAPTIDQYTQPRVYGHGSRKDP